MSNEPVNQAQPPVESSAASEADAAPTGERVERAYILCHFADESPIYKPWLDQLPIPFEVVSGYTPNWEPPDDAAIIITHMHYSWEELSILSGLQ